MDAVGLDVWLVDGRQTKQVPGRKTDVKDSAWIQQLHSYGLLNHCFVPDEQIKELRGYQRMREDYFRSASMHVNHMQKALTLMNIRFKEVLSQAHGVSGMAFIRAILEGERDLIIIVVMSASIIKNKPYEILNGLEGYYTQTGLFALKQACQGYDFYQDQITACDKELEKALSKLGQDNQDNKRGKQKTQANSA